MKPFLLLPAKNASPETSAALCLMATCRPVLLNLEVQSLLKLVIDQQINLVLTGNKPPRIR